LPLKKKGKHWALKYKVNFIKDFIVKFVLKDEKVKSI